MAYEYGAVASMVDGVGGERVAVRRRRRARGRAEGERGERRLVGRRELGRRPGRWITPENARR